MRFLLLLLCVAFIAAAAAGRAAFAEEAADPLSGLYVGVALTTGAVKNPQASVGFEVDFGFAYGANLQVGYALGPFRLEGEMLYQRHEVYDVNPRASSGIADVQYGGWLDSGALMANAYIDLDVSSQVNPYLGFGAGYSRIEAIYSQSDCVFACALKTPLVDDVDYISMWQVMAGITFMPAVPKLGAEMYIGYRYVQGEDMNFRLVGGTPFVQDGLRSHNFELGFRIYFP